MSRKCRRYDRACRYRNHRKNLEPEPKGHGLDFNDVEDGFDFGSATGEYYREKIEAPFFASVAMRIKKARALGMTVERPGRLLRALLDQVL